ncbi:GIN domain-containing protein [Porphyromonas levii]|uniref:Putative auto-transporter adhesin head GIN domain-containing protein n=2 Tax=Porphyromonas levii TaxID=28114 RepID=A0A4Y8WN66_9PORP|nr:DUF2807 domain-containing protein [Porphyromonas levii]MBR8712660.1 hypothetical protein [Porphyromonas levii]MBR8714726.1 hypothetical protein [Porphyromonas levii]MBR8727210.1 hypothetical protein [Porphyromonas levii]MBR8731691.1 hypothetical protein [Porphyromonas levii]MBR8735349.1 hypothetical protein [Porphyromonas levii]
MIKRTWMVLVALLLGVASASAGDVKKNFDLDSSPRIIEVSSAIDVEVISSNRNMMEVVGSAKALKQFEYSLSKGKLVLKRKTKLFDNLVSGKIEIKLYITGVKDIVSIEASGASAVELESNVPLALRTLDISGASKISIEGQVRIFGADVSGASKLDFEGSAQEMILDLSGASRAEVDVLSVNELSVDVSGASGMELTGKVRRLVADVSGASRLDAQEAVIEAASLEASGASRITAKPIKVEHSSATGGSSIRQ